MHAKLLQSCPTLYDPMDGSPPDSSVHRILQTRALEWVARSFSDTAVKNQEIISDCLHSACQQLKLFSFVIYSQGRGSIPLLTFTEHTQQSRLHTAFFVPGRCQPVWPLCKEWLVFPWGKRGPSPQIAHGLTKADGQANKVVPCAVGCSSSYTRRQATGTCPRLRNKTLLSRGKAYFQISKVERSYSGKEGNSRQRDEKPYSGT